MVTTIPGVCGCKLVACSDAYPELDHLWHRGQAPSRRSRFVLACTSTGLVTG